MESKISVELVIPSYNRINILKKTLQQIRILYPNLKICLGLQGDMPDPDFQSQLETDPNLRIEKLYLPSTTITLNHCISGSEADILLILDDDSTPCFGWLESHVAAFAKNPNLPYTSGREVRSTKGKIASSEWVRILIEGFLGLFLGNNKKLYGRIIGWINRMGFLFGNFDLPGTCIINSPRGCNIAIRRELFVKVGGFNNHYRGNAWGFEADFGLRMAKTYGFGLYIGDAIVIHHETASGGSREASKRQWFNDFFYNHKLLIKNLGLQAWLGSIPRLIKKRYF